MRGYLLSGTRRIALILVCALVFGWALMALNTQHAQATPHAHAVSGAGTVAGVLTNGTHRNPTGASAPVAGQKVTLQLVVASSIKDLASTTTSANGAFSFSDVDAGPGDLGGQWAVYTSYQGGMYNSAPLQVKAGQTVDASFAVYDATQDSSNLRVSIATILVREPDVTHGLVDVVEFITIQNTGKTAFVGQPPSGTATVMPALLRFALPPNAINLTPGAGFANTQIIQVDTGFAATATVPPGATGYTFAFQMPYSGTTLAIPFKAVYPVEQVVALVPTDMLAHDASGFAAQGIVTSFGSRYQVYGAPTIAHDGQATLALYQLPRAGERQDLNTTALLWLAGGLAALLALLIGLYLWRGALAAALGLIPPATSATPGMVAGGADGAERKRLLEMLLDLERRHARGDLSDARFKAESGATRQRLRDLMAGSPATASMAMAADSPASDVPVATTPSGAGVAEPAPGGRGGAR